MKIQLYKDEDYQVVQEWYAARNVSAWPAEFISAPSIWISDDDGKKILLLVVYIMENAPAASLAWCVGDPDCKAKKMYMAMDIGLHAVEYICEKEGIKLLYSHLTKLSKSKLLDKHFFIKGAKSVYERMKLWG